MRTIYGHKEETSPSFGGNGGVPYTWTVPEGEYIAKIEYKQDNDWLLGMAFVTDKGTKSPQFGAHGPHEKRTHPHMLFQMDKG